MIDRMTALEIFTMVVQKRSFSAASDELNISRASVTRSIQQLEQWLGIRLILRTTRHIEITKAGQHLLEESREILYKLEKLEDHLSHERQAVSGELKVSLPLGIMNFLFSYLQEFTEQYPELQLNLNFSDHYIDLMNGSIDVAVRGGNLNDTGLFSRKLGHFKDIVVASAEYLSIFDEPLKISDLKDHKCILDTNRPNYDQWIFMEKGKALSFLIKGHIILSQTNAVVEAAIAGMGLAYVPSFAVYKAQNENKLIQVLDRYTTQSYELNIIFADRDFIPKKTRVFIDFLIKLFNNENIGRPTHLIN